MDFIYPKSMPKRYKVTMVLHTLFVLASGHLIAKTPSQATLVRSG